MRGAWLAVALAAAGVAACKGNTAQGAIPRDRFVKANVALRAVDDTAAAGDSLRAAALRRHRVTEKDLQRFVRTHANDPEYLATVWREVADSVQRRYERERLGGNRERRRLPPGMEPPDENARPDSVLGTTPAGEVIMRPATPPPPPPPQGAQPRGEPNRPAPPPPRPADAPPPQQPGTRRPPPPTDRRPIAPPEPTVQRPTTP
ncbi:MAG TPA: hypothetical protein VFS20_19100 [Longimicrobium sp.]|nr:hypothetical protein [Longimicrobium sp.]